MGDYMWVELERRFRDLGNEVHESLRANWIETGWNDQGDQWRLAGTTEDRRYHVFTSLAERAVVMLGHPGGPKSYFRWLDLLKLESPNFDVAMHTSRYDADGLMEVPSGIIYRVCEASADHCFVLQTDAMAEERARTCAKRTPAEDVSGPVDDRAKVPLADAPVSWAAEYEQPTFRRDGLFWLIAFAGCSTRVPCSVGMGYLAYLVQQPRREFHALALREAVSGSAEAGEHSTAGEILDDRAIASYKARAKEIELELAQTLRDNNLARKESLREELEQLADQISSAVGLGGRRREAGKSAERARNSISMAIKRAIDGIQREDKELAEYLRKSIRTGSYFSYF